MLDCYLAFWTMDIAGYEIINSSIVSKMTDKHMYLVEKHSDALSMMTVYDCKSKFGI